MDQGNQTKDLSRFNVIFVALEVAKKEQDENFNLELIASSETNQTISMFREYQENMIESSYTLFTKS